MMVYLIQLNTLSIVLEYGKLHNFPLICGHINSSILWEQFQNPWYVHEETRRQTTCWKILQSQFFHDFSFSGKSSEITVVLQQIKKMFFSNEFKPKVSTYIYSEHENLLEYIFYPSPTRIPMACSKVDKDPEDPEDLEELRHLTFKESAGTREVKDTLSGDTNSSYTQPLKLWKVNIGSEEHPNMASIGDYWDEKTMTEIQALLQEYEDLFPKIFSELKGIKGDLGEMKIELKNDAKPSNTDRIS
jgi:hypothetical protein